MKDERKIRLNLELTAQVRDQIEALQKQSNSSSMTEVIRRSLALYNLILDHIEKHGTIVLRDRDGSDEILRIL